MAATIPVKYTTATPRTTSPQYMPTDVDTGGQAIAQGLQQLGGAVLELGVKIQKAQDASDISTLDRQINENWQEEYNILSTTQDPDERKKLHEKRMQERQEIINSAKNNRVQAALSNRLNSYEPQYQSQYDSLDRTMRRNTMEDELDLTVESAISRNDYSAVELAVGSALNTGYISDAKGESLLLDSKNRINNQIVYGESIKLDEKKGMEYIYSSNLSEDDKNKLANKLSDRWAQLRNIAKLTDIQKTRTFYEQATPALRANNLDFERDVLDADIEERVKHLFRAYIKGKNKHPTSTKSTPDGFDAVKETLFQYSRGEISKAAAMDTVLQQRYGVALIPDEKGNLKPSNDVKVGLSDADYEWAMSKIDNPYPKHIVSNLEELLKLTKNKSDVMQQVDSVIEKYPDDPNKLTEELEKLALPLKEVKAKNFLKNITKGGLLESQSQMIGIPYGFMSMPISSDIKPAQKDIKPEGIVPRNMTKEEEDLTKLSDEELLKRIMGK